MRPERQKPSRFRLPGDPIPTARLRLNTATARNQRVNADGIGKSPRSAAGKDTARRLIRFTWWGGVGHKQSRQRPERLRRFQKTREAPRLLVPVPPRDER